MDLEPASSRPDMQQPRVPPGKPGAGRWDHKPVSEPAAIADAATAGDSGGPVEAVTVVLDGARVGFHSQRGRWRCDEPAVHATDRAAAARAGCLGVVADFLNRGWADPADCRRRISGDWRHLMAHRESLAAIAARLHR